MRVRRVGLLGGESTGKSTLALALADALPAFVAEEYLRDFVASFGRTPLLVDQEGRVAARVLGKVSEASLRALIDSLLDEQAPSA